MPEGELALTTGPFILLGPTEFGLLGREVGGAIILSLLVEEGVEGRLDGGRWSACACEAMTTAAVDGLELGEEGS
jgi:hypothetical protein